MTTFACTCTCTCIHATHAVLLDSRFHNYALCTLYIPESKSEDKQILPAAVDNSVSVWKHNKQCI